MSTPPDVIEAEIYRILEIFEKNCKRFQVDSNDEKSSSLSQSQIDEEDQNDI